MVRWITAECQHQVSDPGRSDDGRPLDVPLVECLTTRSGRHGRARWTHSLARSWPTRTARSTFTTMMNVVLRI